MFQNTDSVRAVWSEISQDTALSAASENSSDVRKDVVRNKIENIKRRLALKWLIIEGDTYYRNRELPLALTRYREFYQEHPDDPLIIEKIGNTYLEMYQFSNAEKYFSKIQEPSLDIKIKIANTYVYMGDMESLEWRSKIRSNIDTLKLPDDLYFYYQNSIKCIDDFASCIFAFEEYFEPSQDWENTPETHPKLQSIEVALENYRNFQLEELYLQQAYVIWALYTEKLYPVSIELSKKVLEEQQNYKPVLKIIAQSHYELWEYKQAKEILTSYYETDSDDPSVAYLLGVINGKLEEFVLSNIYLRKALKIWYAPSINARRQLIHNYYLLENDENMLRAFESLVEEEWSLEKEDLGLAIYHHIIHNKLGLAQRWSQKWQELFPESSNFYAYESWVLREKWELDTALSVLQKGLWIEKENPFILLNIWYTLLEKENPIRAKRYFKDAIDIAPDSQFAQQAKDELKKLEQSQDQEWNISSI